MPRDDPRGLQSQVLWVVGAERVLQQRSRYTPVWRGAREATVKAFGGR